MSLSSESGLKFYNLGPLSKLHLPHVYYTRPIVVNLFKFCSTVSPYQLVMEQYIYRLCSSRSICYAFNFHCCRKTHVYISSFVTLLFYVSFSFYLEEFKHKFTFTIYIVFVFTFLVCSVRGMPWSMF